MWLQAETWWKNGRDGVVRTSFFVFCIMAGLFGTNCSSNTVVSVLFRHPTTVIFALMHVFLYFRCIDLSIYNPLSWTLISDSSSVCDDQFYKYSLNSTVKSQEGNHCTHTLQTKQFDSFVKLLHYRNLIRYWCTSGQWEMWEWVLHVHE